MKNPLRKRIIRQFKGDMGKYLVIFLFMAMTIGFISGFLVAAGSMIVAYDESFTKYNMEHGRFALKEEASNRFLDKMKESGYEIEEQFYKDLPMLKKNTEKEEQTMRVFKLRKKVNMACLMKGELPKESSQIAIDRMFAENNGVNIGDTVTIAGLKKTVTGFVALPDYSALFSNNNDFMFDSLEFGVALVTEDGYKAFKKNRDVYSYTWRYDREPKDVKEESKWADDFMECLMKNSSATQAEIEDIIPRYANQAIQFTGEDMGGDRGMVIVLLYILIAIIAFVFSITLKHTIVKESAVIGTLLASGYTRGEILRHYITTPILITGLAAVIGNILGYTQFKQVAANLYYGSYSLPTYQTIWNSEAFILTTIIPVCIVTAINFITLYRNLKMSPLKFIRRDLSRTKRKKAIMLPHIGFMKRFRIRIVLQNMSGYLVMFVGILFSCILLLFGMMMGPLINHYADQMVEDMFSKNQYILSTRVETENPDAEKFCAKNLSYKGKERDEDATVYGFEENSRYFTEKLSENEIAISSAFSEKYQVAEGDTIHMEEKYEDKSYDFKVSRVISYRGGICIFMQRKYFNEVFEMEVSTFDTDDMAILMRRMTNPDQGEYFTGYLCDSEITDIDEKYVVQKVTEKDMTKLSRQLNKSMGGMFDMVKYFAVFMAVLLIYLLTKLILERNSVSISMIKILGYTTGEICGLYLLTTSIIVLLSVLFSLFFSSGAVVLLFRSFMLSYNGWISVYFDPVLYPIMVFMIMVAYAVVLLLQFRKIQKIPMDGALKNVE